MKGATGRQWHPTPVLLPGRSHGRRSLVGCSPLGRYESGTTKRLHFHFSLSLLGERNGNPLQCSCLDNPRDGRAWWVALYGVAQSWSRLKWLSSSSSGSIHIVDRILRWPTRFPPSIIHTLVETSLTKCGQTYENDGMSLPWLCHIVHQKGFCSCN